MGAGMDMTEEERTRVEEAFQRGIAEDFWEPESRKAKRLSKKKLTKLGKAWGSLTEEDRDDIRFELASRAGGDIDPWILDVGGIANELAAQSTGEAGRTRKYAGMREATKALFQIWVERGNPAEVGNLRQQKKTSGDLTPYPACEFVAEHIYTLSPVPFDNIKNPDHRRDELLRTADTHLRALRKSGEI